MSHIYYVLLWLIVFIIVYKKNLIYIIDMIDTENSSTNCLPSTSSYWVDKFFKTSIKKDKFWTVTKEDHLLKKVFLD